ncbi:hypothetical protein SLS62_000434 [Diatrype stigma]|uniref:Luciferase domain-containing protein n=1 Tax=Diatrype stigma TaxID=117547 RepID=A0AAN9V0S5_9PEZI
MSFARGVVAGIAILAARHLLMTAGVLPLWTNITVGFFLFMFIQRPFTTLYSVPYGLNYLRKQSGLRTRQSFYSLLALSGILFCALGLTLYLNALRAPQRSPLEQWLVFGWSDNKSADFILVVACIRDELAALWFDGVPLLAVATRIYELYKPLCIAAFARPAVWWYSVVPVGLIWSAIEWISCIYTDYSQLLDDGLNVDLGIQGRPPLYIWAFSRVMYWFAGVDVTKRPRTRYGPGQLGALPQRQGPRPTLLGMTQRQVDQLTPPHIMAQLETLVDEVVAAELENDDATRPASMRIANKASFLEGGLQAIRRNLNGQTDVDIGGPVDVNGSFNGPDEFGGEVFHLRRDGTSLAVLHPRDVRAVLRARLGERHRLASGKWSWRFLFHSILETRCPFPEGSVILYAPRNQEEVGILWEIILAAIWNEIDETLMASRTHECSAACIH